MIRLVPERGIAPIDGLRALEALPLWSGSLDFGLETPRALLAALGNPQDRVPAIHVVGTNGKGSVCAMLAAMLHAAGHRVGQFTSPHLSSVCERCVIDGQPVAEKSFRASLEEVLQAAQDLNLEPSYFEVVTAASFLEFSRRELDWVLIEAGLGGRLDATNTIAAPRVSVVTQIGLDHTQVLGETLAEIAKEKAGIFRETTPVVIGEMPDQARSVLTSEALAKGTKLHLAPSFTTNEKSPEDLEIGGTKFKLALQGQYQHKNAATAYRVAKLLGLDDEHIRQGFLSARWPGRMEFIPTEFPGKLLFDVAHNPDGFECLINQLEVSRFYGKNRLTFLLSLLDRKDWRGILDRLKSFSQANSSIEMGFVFTESDHPSAVAASELCQYFSAGDVVRGKEQVIEFINNSLVRDCLFVVSGSIYLVGQLRPAFVKGPFETIAEGWQQTGC